MGFSIGFNIGATWGIMGSNIGASWGNTESNIGFSMVKVIPIVLMIIRS